MDKLANPFCRLIILTSSFYIQHIKSEHHDSSVIKRSHFSSKIFTASVNSTSGGNAPVDSIVTKARKNNSMKLY